MEHLMKRLVQNDVLFPVVKSTGLAVTGLAGWNPQECLDNYRTGLRTNDITLVDMEKKPEPFVKHMLIEDAEATPIMDCDYCASILTTEDSLSKVFSKMCKLPTEVDKYLMFTLSLRGNPSRSVQAMKRITFGNLNDILYDGTLSIIDDSPSGSALVSLRSRYLAHEENSRNWGIKCSIWAKRVIHTQSRFKESVLVRYRDNWEMLTGIVHWN